VYETQEYVKESFWNAAGEFSKVRYFPLVGVHISYLALLGLLIGLMKHGEPFKELLTPNARSVTLALTLVVAVNLAVIIIAYQSSHGHGRFLFPVLGIRKLPSASTHAAGFFLAYCVGTFIYTFAFFAHTLPLPWYPQM
jgi:TRAP-type C4-dicarboxylate transport system permease small subunit